MSYCVNCGVELAAAETKCPLCGVPAWKPEEAAPPYPPTIDRPRSKSQQRRVVLLVLILLLIPIGLCCYNDYSTNGKLSWSLIVSGAELLLFLVICSPILFNRFRPFLCVFVDGAGLTLLLYLIARVADGGWFLPLGLPLAAAGTVSCALFTLTLTRKRHVGFFVKTGVLLLLLGLYTVLTELLITRWLGIPFAGWSVYAAVPCCITSVVSFVLHFCTAVKEQLRRRFFI